MRYKLSVLALILACFVFLPASHAGFWVKSQTAVASSTSNTQKVAPPGIFREFRRYPNSALGKHLPGHRDSGWEGIVALLCGIASIIPFFFGVPAIFAVIFGILGLRHNKPHRGMALAGLIIGGVVCTCSL